MSDDRHKRTPNPDRERNVALGKSRSSVRAGLRGLDLYGGCPSRSPRPPDCRDPVTPKMPVARTQTRSLAIGTDHLHYQSDLFLNLSVIVALVLDQYLGLTGADALFGVGIALWLGWSAYRASHRAVDQLMDKEWPLERRQRFIAVAGHHPLVMGIHDLRTRTSGMHDFAQFHIWVSPAMTVQEAHRVMDEIEARLRPEFPGVVARRR